MTRSSFTPPQEASSLPGEILQSTPLLVTLPSFCLWAVLLKMSQGYMVCLYNGQTQSFSNGSSWGELTLAEAAWRELCQGRDPLRSLAPTSSGASEAQAKTTGSEAQAKTTGSELLAVVAKVAKEAADEATSRYLYGLLVSKVRRLIASFSDQRKSSEKTPLVLNEEMLGHRLFGVNPTHELGKVTEHLYRAAAAKLLPDLALEGDAYVDQSQEHNLPVLNWIPTKDSVCVLYWVISLHIDGGSHTHRVQAYGPKETILVPMELVRLRMQTGTCLQTQDLPSQRHLSSVLGSATLVMSSKDAADAAMFVRYALLYWLGLDTDLIYLSSERWFRFLVFSILKAVCPELHTIYNSGSLEE